MNEYLFEQSGAGAEELYLQETLFHVSNGYLGVRGCPEEGSPPGARSMRGAYINGVYEYIDMKQAEPLYGLVEEKQTMVNAFDTQGIALWADGERFCMNEGHLIENRRSLDMRSGVTRRHILWQSPGGRTLQIDVTRMASFAKPELFMIDYRAQAVDFSGEIVIESTHLSEAANYANPNDPRLAREGQKYLRAQSMETNGARSVSIARAPRSGVTMAVAVEHLLDKPFSLSTRREDACAAQSFRLRLQCKQSVRLIKYTAVSDSLRHADCKAHALAALESTVQTGADELYARQRRALDEMWALCGLSIAGDAALDRAMRFNLYQLFQAVSRDNVGNIAAKGLSGEGYEGHYFWDTEMFLCPFYALNTPRLCRNLIAFRVRQLDAARENARVAGHQAGALYPWRTIMGRECSGYFPSGTAAYHINGAVAYSLMQYWYLTGDDTILAEGGAEMLYEIARLWLDVGVFAPDGRFHINCVTGPDEYTCMVNNNYYTNVLAAFCLKSAAEVDAHMRARGLSAACAPTRDELRAFENAAARMVKPYDPQTGINPQDDAFLFRKKWNFDGVPASMKPLLMHFHPLALYRHQVLKQADTVMAHFILEDEQDEETMRRSFEYYEKITTHDSSLSTCVFSIMASRLNMPEKAYRYFGDSAKMDLENTHANAGDGLHMANMGGSYMSVVYGFAGLRVKKDGVSLRPRLPDAWTGYRFSFHYRDCLFTFFMDSSGWRVRLTSGREAQILIDGTRYHLTQNEPEIRQAGGKQI